MAVNKHPVGVNKPDHPVGMAKYIGLSIFDKPGNQGNADLSASASWRA
jgi:hypothetical protein